MPIILLYMPKASSIFAIVACILAVIVLVTHLRHKKASLLLTYRSLVLPIWGCVGLCFILALSALWSLAPSETIETTGNFLLILLAFFLTLIAIKSSASSFLSVIYALNSGIILALCLLLFDYVYDGSLVFSFRTLAGNALHHPERVYYNRAVMMLASWSLIMVSFLWLQKKRYSASLLFLLVSLVIATHESQTALISFSVAVFMTLFLYVAPKNAARYSMLFGALVYLFGFPLMLSQPIETLCTKVPVIQNSSSEARLYIWHYSMNEFVGDNPLLGHGVGTSHLLHFDYDEPAIPVPCTQDITTPTFMHHAHNGFIQSMVELGALGWMLYAIFVFILLNNVLYGIRSIPHLLMHSSIIYILVAHQTSYDIWQTWYMSFIMLTFILLAMVKQEVETPEA